MYGIAMVQNLNFWALKQLRFAIRLSFNVCLTCFRQTVFWNKTLPSELTGLNYTVYYWGKPIVKSTYVGFALFLYLELFCLCDFFLFLPDFYLVPFLSFEMLFLKGPKHDRIYAYLCQCQLCWLPFSKICFQFQVADAVIHLYIWRQLFISNHLLKPNTFNVIFWNEVTHNSTMVVHNHSSTWYYNRPFSCYIWNMLISDSSFATAGRSSLFVGPLESYGKVWPRL